MTPNHTSDVIVATAPKRQGERWGRKTQEDEDHEDAV